MLGIALTVVESDRALPAAFLVVIEFTQMSDDPLSRPSAGADALDEGVIEMLLPILCAAIATKEQRPSWFPTAWPEGGRGIKRLGLHYTPIRLVPLQKPWEFAGSAAGNR